MDEGEAALVPPITKAHFSFQGKVFVITGGSQGLGKVTLKIRCESIHSIYIYVGDRPTISGR